MLWKSVAIWTSDVFQLITLWFLLFFHIYRMHKTKQRGDFKGGYTLCKIIQLEHVSYIIIISSLLISLITIATKIFEIYFNFLTDNICQIVENTNLILTLVSQFGIHLFVAMRSILSSTDMHNPSVWFKIGLCLVLTDILLIISPFIFTVLETVHINGSCVLQPKPVIFILWIMIQDSIIGIYSLCVFVIPLIKLISWEQQTTHTNNDFTLQSIVHKVIICSTIMILSTMITMTIQAILGPIPTLAANPFIINAYCVVLQFADIRINDIKSPLCQVFIGIIQCDSCNVKCFECCQHSSHIHTSMQFNHSHVVSNTLTVQTKLEIGDTGTGANSENINGSLPTIIVPHLTPASSFQTEPSVSVPKIQCL
eukprot:49658_1